MMIRMAELRLIYKKRSGSYTMLKKHLFPVILLLLCCGCGTAETGDIQEKNNDKGLPGNRVGVVLGWESDYLLEKDKSLEVYKYDEMADMILALRYNKVDAISLDETSVKVVEAMTSGIERVDTDGGTVGYLALFNEDSTDLRDDYNSFLKDYL